MAPALVLFISLSPSSIGCRAVVENRCDDDDEEGQRLIRHVGCCLLHILRPRDSILRIVGTESAATSTIARRNTAVRILLDTIFARVCLVATSEVLSVPPPSLNEVLNNNDDG